MRRINEIIYQQSNDNDEPIQDVGKGAFARAFVVRSVRLLVGSVALDTSVSESLEFIPLSRLILCFFYLRPLYLGGPAGCAEDAAGVCGLLGHAMTSSSLRASVKGAVR